MTPPITKYLSATLTCMHIRDLPPDEVSAIAKRVGSNFNSFRKFTYDEDDENFRRMSASMAIKVEHAARDLYGIDMPRGVHCIGCGECEYARVFQSITEARVATMPVEVRIPKAKRKELRDNEVLFGAYILRQLKEKGVPVDGVLFVCGVTHGRLECRTDLDLAGEAGDEYVFRWVP